MQKLLLTLLICNCAGSLACRLAGSLAFAAAALNSALLQVSLIESLDVLFHAFYLQSFTECNHYTKHFLIFQHVFALFSPRQANKLFSLGMGVI